jgi:arylsulfatase A-like enzyme
MARAGLRRRIRIRYWPLIILLLAGSVWFARGRGLQRPVFQVPSAREYNHSPTAERLRAGAAGANVIIIVLDAARADHFTSFGYARPTTPNLARFFDEAILLTEAYASGASTKPSITSLFTAQFPDTHGTIGTPQAMTQEASTLAECLHAAGYTTAAFSASPALSSAFGFGRGFDSFQEIFRETGMHPVGGSLGRNTEAEATAWVKAHRRDRFFAYLHFREPHAPYGAPSHFVWRVPIVRPPDFPMAEYDRGLAYADHLTGRFLAELRAQGLLDRSIVIVMADHGEAFGEHGTIGHTGAAYREVTRVPVGVRLPRDCQVTPRHRPEVFCLTDLMPTLLDLLQLLPPKTMQGRSRLALLTGEKEPAPGVAISRAFAEAVDGGLARPDLVSYALRVPRYTLVLAARGAQVELYDRVTDPGERRDLAARRPELVAALRAQFAAWADTQRGRPIVLPGGRIYSAPQEATRLDDETRRQLKSLGYLK